MADMVREHVEQSVDIDSYESSDTVVTPGVGKVYRVFKRIMDLIMSAILGVILLFPMIIISLIIRFESKGPAIFKQKRMGKGGNTFTIYKFRTMNISAPPDLAARDFHDSDEYVTKIGAFLRRTSIDELPQLLNIFIGDMSFVGYRPVCLTEKELNQLRMEYGVFTLYPGITGLAQVSGRDNLSYEEKAILDASYVAKCSFKLDCWCILRTVKTIVSGEGAN